MIQHISVSADISKENAERAYHAVFEFIHRSLKKNEPVFIPEFGRFYVAARGARVVRLPNGEPFKVKSKKVPLFNAYKRLKDSTN